jgi:hypothetical protein
MKKIIPIILVVFSFQIYNYNVSAADRLIKKTDNGIYNVEMIVEGKELKLGKNTIDILIRDLNGKGIEGLEITVQPWMPDMGHGIDIEPVINEKGGGIYTLDNVHISMSGHWELKLDFKRRDMKDRVVFDFPHVGGMETAEHEHKHTLHIHHMSGMEPIGVMGGHTHHEGKWMFSYRYMFMTMDGNRDGNNRVDTSDVLNDFMVSPTDMDMQMHMLGVMHAPSNNLTLMAMIPYIHKEMNHVTRTGAKFSTRTEGIGDIKLTTLYKFYEGLNNQLHINAGISLPTGSIDEKGNTPMGQNLQLPYPMQLGSGTFDLLPGITYLGQKNDWSWGTQFHAVVRLGENDNDYTLGDRFALTGWVLRRWTEWLSTSARLDGQIRGDIEGSDPDIASVNMMGMRIVPTADPGLRSGERIDLLFGIDLSVPKGKFRNGRLAVEGGCPLYQYLDGPQLETDWLLTAGFQWSF